MTQATHFIEVFKSNGKYIQGQLSKISDLRRNLGITSSSPALKTIAIWKIKFKNNNEHTTN